MTHAQVTLATWKGALVLHLDYADFGRDIDALRREVVEADEEILREPKGTILALIDLRNTVASGEVVQMFKTSSLETTPHIRRHALIGITGMKRYLADKVARLAGRPMRLFETEEEALDWLASAQPANADPGVTIGVQG